MRMLKRVPRAQVLSARRSAPLPSCLSRVRRAFSAGRRAYHVGELAASEIMFSSLRTSSAARLHATAYLQAAQPRRAKWVRGRELLHVFASGERTRRCALLQRLTRGHVCRREPELESSGAYVGPPSAGCGREAGPSAALPSRSRRCWWRANKAPPSAGSALCWQRRRGARGAESPVVHFRAYAIYAARHAVHAALQAEAQQHAPEVEVKTERFDAATFQMPRRRPSPQPLPSRRCMRDRCCHVDDSGSARQVACASALCYQIDDNARRCAREISFPYRDRGRWRCSTPAPHREHTPEAR